MNLDQFFLKFQIDEKISRIVFLFHALTYCKPHVILPKIISIKGNLQIH